MFKRFVTILTIIGLVLSTVSPISLFADEDIGMEGRICRDLGILKGDTGIVDNAYLETRPSRLQAAIMFLRLKGLEEDALSYRSGSNFKDASAIAWEEGRNVLRYLKNNPQLGWIGDGTNFHPYNLISSKEYYKVLLESLGYKQIIDEDGDFSWNSVLEFAEDKGLYKVADVKDFTVRNLAVATVEALKTRMKDSGRKLIEYLVDIGEVDRYDAISLDLLSGDLDAAVKTVRAISNSKVEVVFDESIAGTDADDEDIYNIRGLSIKGVSIKNDYAVIIDTSSMDDGDTYELEFDNRDYSFRGLKKDTSAPKLIKAECRDTELVELTFDRVMDNVTAQDTDTYSINGAEVRSAELDSTNTKVRLRTKGVEASRSYDLKIRNIKNGDGVAAKSISKRFVGRKDTTAPKLTKLTVLNNIKLLLEFSDSNGLDKASAGDIDNYKITYSGGSLDIEEVKVKDMDDDGFWDSVELVTESQESGKTYTLTIEEIEDASVSGNKSTRAIKKEFRGKSRDKSGPSVTHNPKAVTNTMVEVEFSDSNALDIESACDPGNYEIDKGLDVIDVRIKDPDNLYSAKGRTVLITTSEMEKKETYTLIISYVMDEFGNEMKSSGSKKYRFKGLAEDRTPPYITSVECSGRTINLNFDNPLDEESAEDIYNYRIDGLALVTKAELLEGDKTVRLTVSSLSSDKNHTLLLDNIEDMSGNAMSNVKVNILYIGNQDDDDPPEISDIDAVNEYEVWIEFDEPIYAVNARMKASGVDFIQVGSILEDETTIVMKASKSMEDKEYEVTSLTNVWDTRNNPYELEAGLDFYGTDSENEPPEVDDWEQMDVRRFRVIFTEPVLIKEGKDRFSLSGIEWKAVVNPDEEDDNEAYSTVDYTATNKNIPPDKEFEFNFTALVSDYVGLGAYDDEDYDRGGSGCTILESYMEDDEEPYIDYVEAVTQNQVQVIFSEEIREPGRYSITYDDDGRDRTVDIDMVEVDNKDRTIVNIFTEDDMSDEYYYILEPKAAAIDIAGNKLDIRDLEIEFEGTNIKSSEYIQGVEVLNSTTLRVNKSSRINKVSSLYELDEDGDTIGGNLIKDTSKTSDNVYRITSKKHLLKDARYEITVDGISYKFSGGVPNGDLELELPEREITYRYMDMDKHQVRVFKADGKELAVERKSGYFEIAHWENIVNGELLYLYVVQKADKDTVIYGTRVEVEGMHYASSSKEITRFGIEEDELDIEGHIDNKDNTIKLYVPYGANIKNLAATFRCSDYAVVKVGSETQISGKTRNDFSKELVYTVYAQDGSKRNYTVIVIREESELEKKITSFILEEPDPDIVGKIDQKNHVITLVVPAGLRLDVLRPVIETSSGTKVRPESGEKNDFSIEPIIYKVIAKDGSVQNYTVEVIRKESSANLIKSFEFKGVKELETVIESGSENTVSIKVPHDTVRKRLIPIISISEHATIYPESEVENDFRDEVIYTVTAQDGSKRKYRIIVTAEQELDKAIKSFRFEGLGKDAIGNIDEESSTITVMVPYDTTLKRLVPTIIIPKNTDIYPKSGEEQDFRRPVEYIVTAEDGSTRKYTVYVQKVESSANRITSFAFPELDPVVSVDVGEDQRLIELAVPHGTDVTQLKAAFRVSPEAVVKIGEAEQVSGRTANDFTDPVKYKVVAQDGSVREYKVVVNEIRSSEKQMKEFGFISPAAVGTIDEATKNISIKVPHGIALNQLKAVFKSSEGSKVFVGDTEQRSGETVNDFTNPVKYTVVAQDRSRQDYIVTVSNVSESEKYFSSFSFEGLNPAVKGIINHRRRVIMLNVPRNTDLSKLVASFSFVGKSVHVGNVQQYSGKTENNFRRRVVYRITAFDDSVAEYTVIVNK